MPSSHLPRTPCDKFVYDFMCDFWGIIGSLPEAVLDFLPSKPSVPVELIAT